MITEIIAFLKNLFGATEAVAKAVTQERELKNTPDQQANAEAAQIQADRDKLARDIANQNQTEFEKDVSP